MSAKPNGARKKISLALQGGGALGAYTWGVLDRILEDERIEIVAVSGASAGAMNAVVMADGFHSGGAEGARAELRRFWEGVARAGLGNPYRRTPLAAYLNAFTPEWARAAFAPWATWADLASRVASPYDYNPLNLNPLKELIEELVDFERVRACRHIELFVSATHVQTGRIAVFDRAELTAEHVMASACLPMLFQTVEIEGEPYWDGGYMGNPALFPLFDVKSTRDILIVQINPIERDGVPRSAPEIIARVNEINFNSSLLSELRAIDFVARLLGERRLPEVRYREMLIHMVYEGGPLRPLGVGIDLNTDLAFFSELFTSGRAACERWLERNFDTLGERSSVDLRALFEGRRTRAPQRASTLPDDAAPEAE